jgi:hypothetical protein
MADQGLLRHGNKFISLWPTFCFLLLPSTNNSFTETKRRGFRPVLRCQKSVAGIIMNIALNI